MKVQTGFFAKINSKYVGPFLKLSEARNEARPFGKDVAIFSGNLQTDDSGTQIDNELYLVPKVRKGNV